LVLADLVERAVTIVAAPIRSSTSMSVARVTMRRASSSGSQRSSSTSPPGVKVPPIARIAQ
jgi:hypothetical protein